MLSVGVGDLPVSVGFGLRGEPELAAAVGRRDGTGAPALDGSCFEFAAVRATDDVGFGADAPGEDAELAGVRCA